MTIRMLCMMTAGFLLMEQFAEAYIDPGTGSMVLQGLIGAIAAGLALGTVYWKKLKSLLGISRERVVQKEGSDS